MGDYMFNDAEAINSELGFSKQWKLKEIANTIFDTLLCHAKKLGEFEKRIEAYEKTNGFESVRSDRQMYVQGDFYGYIKNTQKDLIKDFIVLNQNFHQCSGELKKIAASLELPPNSKKIVESEGIIQFRFSTVEDDALLTLKKLITKGEDIMLSVDEEQKKILIKTESVIVLMRKQF